MDCMLFANSNARSWSNWYENFWLLAHRTGKVSDAMAFMSNRLFALNSNHLEKKIIIEKPH
jgi:hypothetical protein